MDRFRNILYRSGLPFSVVDGTTIGDLQAAGTNLLNATVLGEPISTVPLSCGAASVNTACFSSAQFASGSAVSGFGTVPRNSFRGPGYFNTDLGLKKILSTEREIGTHVGRECVQRAEPCELRKPYFQSRQQQQLRHDNARRAAADLAVWGIRRSGNRCADRASDGEDHVLNHGSRNSLRVDPLATSSHNFRTREVA
jgi:hypothetical protein